MNLNQLQPNSPDALLVHKEGEEGTMVLDRLSGRIVTPLDERPDWAEGLTTALVQERVTYYEKRLGADSEAFKAIQDHTQAIEFSDLGWLGVDAEQHELEVQADLTYRSEVVAKALGIDTETGEMSAPALAEREVTRENRPRTQAEMKALEESVEHGFQGEGAQTENANRQQAASR